MLPSGLSSLNEGKMLNENYISSSSIGATVPNLPIYTHRPTVDRREEEENEEACVFAKIEKIAVFPIMVLLRLVFPI